MKFRRLANPAIRLLILLGVCLFVGPGSSPASDSKGPANNPMAGPEPDPDLFQGAEARRARANSAYSQTRGESPPPTDPGTEVIYGADDRKEYYQIGDPYLAQAAQAVCLVVDVSELSDNGNGTYTLSTSTFAGDICTDERFYGQPTAGFCTGFLVGTDLVATAGHCVDNSTCGATAFVFGWWIPNSTTPAPVIIPASDVYFCSGIVNQIEAGDNDHCVLQVDRDVTGRNPVGIRRSGSVSNGDSLSVIGHGIVIPMKEAGGAVVQNANGVVPWFQANLDTYGGNSGSPVFNRSTYEVEGILVRGAPDFVFSGGCYRSNVVPNTGNPGSGLPFEEVSKTTAFAAYVPLLVLEAGSIEFLRHVYGCADLAQVEMRDLDLAGTVTQSVQVTSQGGDAENLSVAEGPPGSGIFQGTIAILGGVAVGGNGILEVSHGESITAVYNDADDGTGFPATVADTASIDCVLPAISNVQVQSIVGTQVTITFDTDEAAQGSVETGPDCASLSLDATGASGQTTHSIMLTGLASLTAYDFAVGAADAAGNFAQDDNGGLCYSFTTLDQPDYFTELFSANDGDLDSTTLTFTPDGSADYYRACIEAATAFPTAIAGSTPIALGDDAFYQINLSGGEQVKLYGVSYSSCFVGSNGYITFGSGDLDFSESLVEHFSPAPRIALLFDDLDPGSAGTVYYRQLANRLVVTYVGVTEFSAGNSNFMQAELYFDGEITITHLSVAAADGLVGLSAGLGLPGDFVESDLSNAGICVCTDPDFDGVCAQDDNCADLPNPNQANADSDSLGDVCDPCPALVTPGHVALITGDINHNTTIASDDVILLVNYTFKSGPPPSPVAEVGDVNCSGTITSADIIDLVNYVFKSGEPPCDVCALP